MEEGESGITERGEDGDVYEGKKGYAEMVVIAFGDGDDDDGDDDDGDDDDGDDDDDDGADVLGAFLRSLLSSSSSLLLSCSPGSMATELFILLHF